MKFNFTVVSRHNDNPIKTSYELLWNEIRDMDQKLLNQTLQSVMRRIIENNFKFFGNIDVNKIINKFDGNKKLQCRSLTSWLHDGSHSIHDDLNISSGEDAVDKYFQVFKSIFDKSSHIMHYNHDDKNRRQRPSHSTHRREHSIIGGLV